MFLPLILFLYHRISLRQKLLGYLLLLELYLSFAKYKHIKKYVRKLQPRRRRGPRAQSVRIPSRKNRQEVDPYYIYDRTALFEDTFEEVHSRLMPSVTLPRVPMKRHTNIKGRKTRTALTTRRRLVLVLHTMRDNLNYKTAATLYEVIVLPVSTPLGLSRICQSGYDSHCFKDCSPLPHNLLAKRMAASPI